MYEKRLEKDEKFDICMYIL